MVGRTQCQNRFADLVEWMVRLTLNYSLTFALHMETGCWGWVTFGWMSLGEIEAFTYVCSHSRP